jgi:folate/biopterin transporter
VITRSEKANWFKDFKFDIELGAIALVYFVQGALGLAHLAVSFFLKDRLGLSPAEVASLVGIAMVPWTIKPIYGMISDSFPIAGYRRRPYLVLSSLLGTIAWLCMAMVVKTPLAATIAIGLASLSVACSDAITDALVVQRARLESEGDAGSLQSFSWAAVSIGAISSAYFSGFILERWGTQVVFEITAALPILVAIAAFAISDRTVKLENSADLAVDREVSAGVSGVNLDIKHQLQQLRQAVTSKQIWLPAAFIFLWQATPSADTAFFFFSTNELGFNPEFLGTVRLATSLAGLLGVWIFQRYLKSVPMRRIFLWSTLISTFLGLTSLILITHANRSLGIDDRWFSMGDSLILTVAGRIAYMPVLVLAARLCPEGIEATLFALLMSVMNIAALCSYQLGAGFTYFLGVTDVDFTNLWLLVLITNLSNLLPLPLLGWLPETQTAIAGDSTPLSHPQPTLPEPSNPELPNVEPVAVAVTVPAIPTKRLPS